MSKTTAGTLLLVGFALASCKSAVHSSEALLLESEDGVTYVMPRGPESGHSENFFFYDTNPVYISKDSTFSLRVMEVRPGWVHQDEKVPAIDNDDHKWSKSVGEHLKGKELWLLTTIRSLDIEDPLGLNSKTYQKSSHIKLGSGSFGLLALDESEQAIFTHDSDSSYSVEFKLFEVDNLKIKRAIAKAARSPGVSGLLTAAYETLKNTLGALAGDSIVSFLKKYQETPILFERLLLTAGAELEFQGTITVLVGKEPLPEEWIGKARIRDYLLYDWYKSEEYKSEEPKKPHTGPEPGVKYLFTDRGEYLDRLKAQRQVFVTLEKDKEKETPSQKCFLRFNVAEVIRKSDNGNTVEESATLLEETEDPTEKRKLKLFIEIKNSPKD